MRNSKTDVDKLVYIIVLNWNGWLDTAECIESCQELAYSNFHILIVDNGSMDDSETILRGRFPSIELVQTGKNLGFAGGNNAGMRCALERGADYIWLLNNDTVVDREALNELVKVADAKATNGMVGSKIYYYDEPKKIWFAGGVWRKNILLASHRGQDETDYGQYNEICEVDFVTGCSLLIKSSVIKEIGMMNEEFFLYWEEIDWNATAYEKGWEILYAPGSVVWHKVGSSIEKQSQVQTYYNIRNALLFFKKHEPMRLPMLFVIIIFGAAWRYMGGRGDRAWGYIQGMLDFIIKRFGEKSKS